MATGALGQAIATYANATLGKTASVDAEATLDNAASSSVSKTTVTGGTDGEATATCSPGTYSLLGATSCVACARGTFGNRSGLTECALADAGFFAASSGASSQFPCAPGRYTSGPGYASCTPCPVGQLARSNGSTACDLAQPGSFVPATGTYEASECAPGRYAEAGASFCVPCEPNTFGNRTGLGSCELCVHPATTLKPGAVSCDACAAGYYRSPATNLCVECPADGSRCLEAGVGLATLPLLEKWWRASRESAKLYECALDKACAGGIPSSNVSAPYCAEGHRGPLCGVCADGHALDRVTSACVRCPRTPYRLWEAPGKLVSVTMFVATVLAGLYLYFGERRIEDWTPYVPPSGYLLPRGRFQPPERISPTERTISTPPRPQTRPRTLNGRRRTNGLSRSYRAAAPPRTFRRDRSRRAATSSKTTRSTQVLDQGQDCDWPLPGHRRDPVGVAPGAVPADHGHALCGRDVLQRQRLRGLSDRLYRPPSPPRYLRGANADEWPGARSGCRQRSNAAEIILRRTLVERGLSTQVRSASRRISNDSSSSRCCRWPSRWSYCWSRASATRAL